MAKSGRTLAGQKLWTKAEIEHLRRTYPDYCKARASFTEPKPQAPSRARLFDCE